MIIVELPKFRKIQKPLEKTDDNLELWIYLMLNAPFLSEADMKTMIRKNPVMEETLETLKRISINPRLVSVAEMREKGERDYNTQMKAMYDEGIEKGIEKGIAEGKAEGIAEGIEKGRAEGLEKAVRALYSHRMSREEIARNLDLSLDQVEQYLSRQQ